MATKKTHYVAEQQSIDEKEGSLTMDGGAQRAPDGEVGEPRCSICDELLAWHEQACSALAPIPVEMNSSSLKATASIYVYDLGHLVQPMRQAPARTIIWRGQLKERHPQTGLVYRVNVYRLNDDFWDCYHEDELQAA